MTDPSTTKHSGNSTSERRETTERRQGSRRAGFDRRMPERKFLADEYIFREGEAAKLCYQIVSGKVGIFKQLQGEFKEIVEFGEGDILGEMALIDNAPRRASAKAKEATVLKQIHQRAFLDYLSQSPDTAMSIMKRLMAYARSSMDAFDTDSISLAEKAEFDLTEGESRNTHLLKLASANSDNKDIIDEFQNPSDSLIRKRPPMVTRWAFFSIFLVFTALLLWASFSKVDITLTVPGELSTAIPTIPVTADYHSTVRTVHIEPGEPIKKGEIIATLDTRTNISEQQQNQIELNSLEQQIERLKLEKLTPTDTKALDKLNVLEKNIYLHRLNTHKAQLNQHTLEIERARLQLEYTQTLLTQKKIKQSLAQTQTGLEDTSFSQEIASLKTEISLAQNILTRRQAEKESYILGRQREISSMISMSLLRQKQLTDELLNTQSAPDRLHLLAPSDGIVTNLHKLYEGASVAAGEKLLSITPTNVPLTVNMNIRPEDINKLTQGSKVKVKIISLPYQQHGVLIAELNHISYNSKLLNSSGETVEFYPVQATIKDNKLHTLPANFKLLPGTKVKNEIHLANRRLINYFLYPINATLDSSFSEP